MEPIYAKRGDYRKNTVETTLINEHLHLLKHKAILEKNDFREKFLRGFNIFGDLFQALLALFSSVVYVISTIKISEEEDNPKTYDSHSGIAVFVHISEYVFY